MAKRTTRQHTPPSTAKTAEQMTEIQNKIAHLEALVTDVIPEIQKSVKETQESIQELKELLDIDKVKAVKGLMDDMAGAPAEISKELHEVINDLRERFERDETLTLLKMTGDNIPLFVELLSTMKAVKGLMDDMAEAPAKITKELHSTLNDLRERFERDETLTLIKMTGDNIPTFVELLSTMQAVKGLMDDMADAPAKITKELTPTINELRERFESDDTLAVMKMMGDNLPTLVNTLQLMPAFKGLMEDILPNAEKIIKELVPTINVMREAFEKDETIELLLKTGSHISTFNQLIDFLTEFKRRGHFDFSLKQALDYETEYLIKGLELCASKTMKEFEEEPITTKPSLWRIFKTMNDEEVRRGIVIGTTFLRNMHQCMLNAMERQDKRAEQVQ
jgi:uncharacterized protein YjgD (DUF1641 family)